MKDLLKEARSLYEKNELTDSLKLVDDYIRAEENNIEALLLRARISYKMQKWGDAMNDYYSVLELDPLNKEAKSGRQMAGNILGYFTPDMFNP